MKSIQRFLIAILLLTGLSGLTYAQHGPGGNDKSAARHGNPDKLNLSDSCWRVFISQLPDDSAQMLVRALECLKESRDEFARLWQALREAHAAKDTAKIREIRALLAELRAKRNECAKVVKTILRQYHDLFIRVRHDCGRKRPDGTGGHDGTIGIKLGPIMPNPVPTGQTTATLTYGIATDSRVVITTSDALGNVVKEVFSGDLTAGPQTQTLDLNGLNPGMYYVRIQTADAVATARLVIQ